MLWDLDGTLIDSRDLWQAAYRSLAETLGGNFTSQLWQRITGHTIEVSVELLLADIGIDPHAATVTNACRRLVDVATQLSEEPSLVRFQPGARQALQLVQDAGIRTALVTTTWRALTDRLLDLLDVTFDVTVCGDETSRGKPAAEPYLRAAALLDVDPAHCVAIEDSDPGVKAAEAAGVAVLAVTSDDGIGPRPRRAIRRSLVGLTVTELATI